MVGLPALLYKKGAELTLERVEESVTVIKKVIVTPPEVYQLLKIV